MPKTKGKVPRSGERPAWRRTEHPAPNRPAVVPVDTPMTREAREAWAREVDDLRALVKTGPRHRTAEDLVRAVRDEESGAEG